MSSLILWIVGIIWFVMVPALIWAEDRGVGMVQSLVVWGAVTAAALTGYAVWTFVRVGGV